MGELDVSLEFFEHGQVEETKTGTRCHGIAGCFFGMDGGCCRFGVNLNISPDIEQLAGVMGHEVAHAYRSHHRLQVDDRDREELLTDLTTVL
jgi:hypothetical protein